MRYMICMHATCLQHCSACKKDHFFRQTVNLFTNRDYPIAMTASLKAVKLTIINLIPLMRIAKCLYVTRDLATRREKAQKKPGSCSNLTMFGFLLCARRCEVTLPSSC